MRWFTSNFMCRFIQRHLLGVLAILILVVCANQLIQFTSRYKESDCYQIISPFANIPLNGTTFISSSSGKTLVQSQLFNLTGDQFPNPPFVPPRFLWSQSRFDNRRMLRIYEWIWTGSLWDELMNRFDVCLSTQCSIDRISSIGEVSEKWLGPISLGVYITTLEEWDVLNEFVAYMQRCSALFTQTVSIHLAIPTQNEFHSSKLSKQTEAKFNLSKIFANHVNLLTEYTEHPCGQPAQFLSLLMKKYIPGGIDPSALYPQNHLRNLARKSCGTPWVFMTDVDIIPRPNSSSMLQEFYQTPAAAKCLKCAFVIPVYELDRTVPYPTTKRQLTAYTNKGLARQFHLKIYRYGHWATNYSLWMKTNLEEEPVKISHSVEMKMNHYEPFYISSDDIPPHDERFVGYGFTRSSQVLEARIRGWRFQVLTPIYAIHWGLQVPQSNRSPVLKSNIQIHQSRIHGLHQQSSRINPRKVQNSFNQIIYTDFVAELMAKHNISMTRKAREIGSKGLRKNNLARSSKE